MAVAATNAHHTHQDPSILYENADSTIFLIDIPHSISEGQQSCRRILSSKPLERPYPSTEPKSQRAKAMFEKPSLDELILQKHLQLTLEQLRAECDGGYTYPRFICISDEHEQESTKRKRENTSTESKPEARKLSLSQQVVDKNNDHHEREHTLNNQTSTTSLITTDLYGQKYIPPFCTAIPGNVLTTPLPSAPKFNLIIIDPPWPNRSARRSKSYSISSTTSEIRSLLKSLEVEEKLADDGLVAVWITNKKIFEEMIIDEGGLFEQWGVELIEEWVWLKITTGGEPICALDSVWRKPWEVLLVGRRRRGGYKEGKDKQQVKRRVVVGVPDVHSRKPSLKRMFEDIFGLKMKQSDIDRGVMDKDQNEYEALEIFARHLTAGWWSWGDECLLFQGVDHWEKGRSEEVDVSLHLEEALIASPTPMNP